MLPFVVNVPSEISISKNRLGQITNEVFAIKKQCCEVAPFWQLRQRFCWISSIKFSFNLLSNYLSKNFRVRTSLPTKIMNFI